METSTPIDVVQSPPSDNVGSFRENVELTPTPQRRRRHDDNGHSDADNNSISNADLDDSGNYSSSSLISDGGTDLQHNCVRYQNLLREKEQSLFLAIQDVRKLRSELERLSKSEQWYKQELRQQKTTRLEALERLYTQERNYMQENQRLQRECVRLYTKCAELEQDLEAQKQSAMKKLKSEENECVEQHHSEVNINSSQFEIEQQQALIIDQQQLITVLRKQKRALLDDLQRLNMEKDEKVLILQRTLAGMELENTHITSKCKQLLDVRQNLEQKIQYNAEKSTEEAAERQKLHNIIGELRNQLDAQELLLAQREGEILDLQTEFKAKLHAETNVDKVHQLSVTYHEEINAKTLEIRALKTSLLQLQDELVSLGSVQAQNDQHERHIANLNFTLETHQYELAHLQKTDASKTQQIAELQQNLEHCLGVKDAHILELAEAESKIKTAESELIALHDKYANMCALCERTKFELQLYEIEQNKLKFQTESDKRDIEQLREKLKTYLHTTTELSRRIATLEAELDSKSSVKIELQTEAEAKLNSDPESIAYVQALQVKLMESKQIISELQQANNALKEEQLIQTCMTTNVAQTVQEPQVASIENKVLTKTIIETESMALLVNEIKDFKTTQYENEAILQLQETLQQKTAECDKFSDQLFDKDVNFKKLQLQLLKTDAKLYKQQRAWQQQGQINSETSRENANAVAALQIECKQLNDNLKSLYEAKQQLETELRQEKASVKALSETFNVSETETKSYSEREVQTDEVIPVPIEPNIAGMRQAERVHMLQQLLQQQNERVQQLSDAQQEWEELLRVLNATQKLEEKNRHELALKHAELEELNELFAEQNIELQQLQQHNYEMHQRQCNDNQQMHKTFQTQLNELTIQLNERQTEIDEKQNIITTLQQTNQRLQQRLDDDYAEELATHNKQLRTLQAKVGKLQQERETSTLRLHEMAKEITTLKRNREQLMTERNAGLQLNFDSCSSETDTDERLSVSGESTLEDGNNPGQDQVKILTRVLEAEYKRKMKRYDLHISTLLGNVKSLKRSLKTAEHKTAVLSTENANSKAKAEDLRSTKMHLEEMRLKYEQSQTTVKALEQQLAIERKRYEASDLGKYANSAQLQQQEVTHEVANLIDDYKKLIQQSAATTQRLKTSAILDLIQRSNQCVPNLNKLETSVSDLHSDVQQFLSTLTQHQTDTPTQHFGVYPFVGVYAKRPSLMDELRVAEQF